MLLKYVAEYLNCEHNFFSYGFRINPAWQCGLSKLFTRFLRLEVKTLHVRIDWNIKMME